MIRFEQYPPQGADDVHFTPDGLKRLNYAMLPHIVQVPGGEPETRAEINRRLRLIGSDIRSIIDEAAKDTPGLSQEIGIRLADQHLKSLAYGEPPKIYDDARSRARHFRMAVTGFVRQDFELEMEEKHES